MTYDPSSMNQLNRTEPSYLTAYGLKEAPFSSQQDDRFLYLTPSLSEQLNLLSHYTQYGNLLLMITGERGVGKSSLKQRFINTAQEEWRICEIQAHTMMDSSLLLKQVAQGFGITEPPFDASSLHEVLSEQLQYLHQSSFEPILIIDDAHELPQDSLQSLLYLAEHHSDQETALRIILFCEPEIETMLEDPSIHSLKERVTHSIDIPTLNEEETAEYLRFRLAVAGLDGTSPFTPKLINKIYKASGGLPSQINEYAHQNLLDDREPITLDELESDETFTSDRPLSIRNLLLGGLALGLVIMALLFQDKINAIFEEQPELIENSDEKNTVANELKQTKPTILPENKVSETQAPIEQKTIEISLNKNENTTKEAPKSQKVSEDEVKKEQPTKTKLHLSSVNPNPVPASQQRQIISISGTGFHKRQKVKVRWTDKVKVLGENQVNVTSDTYMNLILNVGTQNDTWSVTLNDPLTKLTSNTISFKVVADNITQSTAIKSSVPVIAPVITKKTTPVSSPQKTNGLYDQNWIVQQNKNHFTLQLLGTHQKTALPNYLKKFNLTNDAASFKTQRNGKDWFTLVYGAYPTKEAAQTASKQLAKGIDTPWVRSFASILPSLDIPKTSASQIQEIATTKAEPIKTIPANQDGWLWSQDPRHYTLQLTAGSDKAAIQRFIKRHNLTGKAVYFHRLRDGKDWYILVYGSFSGYSKAKQAIGELPSAVQKAKPWARSFSAIHAELN